MNDIVKKLMGMGPLTDQVISSDMLQSAKAGIKSYALAITETATPEIRQVLVKQLDEAITQHRNIALYMIDKGYYHPHDSAQQLEQNLAVGQTAINLAKD
ncbi:spore coat protein [Terribacillus saccharophilus]|uniref:spore coat protein n=1 Tax=Terribacillus saccharophilus TaxID=361277 RepID=UPI003982156F